MLGAGRGAARWPARGDHVTVLQRRPAGLGLPEVLADVADRRGGPRAPSPDTTPSSTSPPRSTSPGAGRSSERTNVTGTRVGRRRLSRSRRTAPGARVLALGRPRRVLAGRASAPSRPIRTRARGPYARSKAIAELIALAADGPQLRGARDPSASGLGTRRHPAGGPDRRAGPARRPAGGRVRGGAGRQHVRRQRRRRPGRRPRPGRRGPRTGPGGQQRRTAADRRVARRPSRRRVARRRRAGTCRRRSAPLAGAAVEAVWAVRAGDWDGPPRPTRR